MYPNLPSLNSLKVFDTAARLGSFKKAAAELFITPTAVSHQIKTLEEALGAPLFERKTRAVLLTNNGLRLAETTSIVFQQLSATVSEITDSNRTLTVSTTSSFAAMWLVPNLDGFYQTYPNIDISVMTGEEVLDIERDRRIDVAIRYGKYDPDKKNTVLLAHESIGLYATPGYLEEIKDISKAQLLETKWVNQSLPPVNWQLILNTTASEVSVRQFAQEHHVIQAALAGQGVALVSSLLVRSALNNRWLVPCMNHLKEREFGELTYYALVPSRHKNNETITAFLNWLRDQLS
ncbi:LysR substrate-binding domain-containing protein [Microbulbifer sp. OS29]|uniref:LysR substrate-binding domain-containing protein n=1 Tax=Microbulbifer okhotskensis TaxID=2926617 RepID=A0A9X2J6D9_9GAMM|nr:LysR substrate-binding domain-containing protein [Microbulbifer okhotskensis]MCO1336178.1 LysR substrate-binding domain-containing protein [Microbulbifer okhotskensis]